VSSSQEQKVKRRKTSVHINFKDLKTGSRDMLSKDDNNMLMELPKEEDRPDSRSSMGRFIADIL